MDTREDWLRRCQEPVGKGDRHVAARASPLLPAKRSDRTKRPFVSAVRMVRWEVVLAITAGSGVPESRADRQQ